MSDRLMAEALRSRDRGALAALYDSYAEGIYRYCHFVLQSADTAQVVLRDTFIVAEARIHRLADPERLRPWMYALARRECTRRGIPEVGAAPDEPGRGTDADLRVMAWNAVAGLTSYQREALELGTRHGMAVRDVAAVMGLPQRAAEELITSARDVLQGAVTAEVLARKGPYDCMERARILAGFGGRFGPELRDQVIQHVSECPRCSAHQARQVSAAKVYAMLPAPDLPRSLRSRVVSCFTDPELVPYRRFAARRAGPFDADGFPGTAVATGPPKAWPRAVAGALTTTVALLLIVAGLRVLGAGTDGSLVMAGPGGGRPPGLVLPWHTPSPQPLPTLVPVHRWPPTQPIGSWSSTEPLTMTWVDAEDLRSREHLVGPPPPGDGHSPGPGGDHPSEPGQTPGEPTPGEPRPTPGEPDPTPSDPRPSDPPSSDPTPSDPAPSDPKPTPSDPDPAPSESRPTSSPPPAPTPSKEPSRGETPGGEPKPREPGPEKPAKEKPAKKSG